MASRALMMTTTATTTSSPRGGGGDGGGGGGGGGGGAFFRFGREKNRTNRTRISSNQVNTNPTTPTPTTTTTRVFRIDGAVVRCRAAAAAAGGSGNQNEAPIAAAMKSAPLYYNSTLTKGTHLEHSGDVIVVGNVEKDASITTEDGDIVVFGSLRGEAIVRSRYGASSGEGGGKIFALDMRPEVLEIDQTQMSPPEHLLDAGVEVKDTRAFTGIPMVAEKSETTGEITFSKFYGRRSGAAREKRGGGGDDVERYYERKEKNTLSSDQLKRCKTAAKVTGTYILAVGVCLFFFPRRLFHLMVPVGETLSTTVWLRVVATAAIAFGLYYRAVAKNGETGFYKATVTGRYFVGASLLLLALFSQHANAALFAFGLVNFLGAFAMKNSLEFGRRRRDDNTNNSAHSISSTSSDAAANNNNNTKNNWANPSN